MSAIVEFVRTALPQAAGLLRATEAEAVKMSIEVVRDRRVACITVNRPEVLNALSTDILDGLRSGARGARGKDDAVGAVVLTGAGDQGLHRGRRHRRAGGEDAAAGRATTVSSATRSRIAWSRCASPRSAASPTATRSGGSCEMALACDIRLCCRGRPRSASPEVNLGIMPGWGGTQRLARTTTLGYAKEILLTGRMISAEEAFAPRARPGRVYPQATTCCRRRSSWPARSPPRARSPWRT